MTTIQSLKDAGAKPMWGDMTNKASLRAALAGVDTVIAASNPVKQWGKDSIEPADRGGMWNLIDEAGKAGVRRFLLASLTGAAGQGRQIVVITNWGMKTCRPVIMAITVAKRMVGCKSGSVIERKTCNGLAPSTLAASMRSPRTF